MDLTFPNPDYEEPADILDSHGNVVGKEKAGTAEFYHIYEEASDGTLIVPRYYWHPSLESVGQKVWYPVGESSFTRAMTCKPRPYQQPIIDQLNKSSSDLNLKLAPAFGKSFLALYRSTQFTGRVLIVVPSVVKKDEWILAAQQFLGISREDIGVIQGPLREWDKSIVVGVVNTLAQQKFPIEIRNGFRLVIYDECHMMTSPTMCQVLGKFSGTQMLLSATPGSGVRKKILNLHCGTNWLQSNNKELPLHVYFAIVDVNDWIKGLDWRMQCTQLHKDKTYMSAFKHFTSALLSKGHKVQAVTGTISPLVKLRHYIGHGDFVIGAASMRAHVMPAFPEIYHELTKCMVCSGETTLRTKSAKTRWCPKCNVSSTSGKSGMSFPKRVAQYNQDLKGGRLVLATGTTKKMPGGTGWDWAEGSGQVVFFPIRGKDMCYQLLGRMRRIHGSKPSPQTVVLVPDSSHGLRAMGSMQQALKQLDGITYSMIQDKFYGN